MRKFTAALIAAVLCIIAVPVLAEEPVRVTVDGRELAFDQPPIIENDRVLVPVRAIFEALGARVTWQEQNRQVTAAKDADTVILWIGKQLLYRNGDAVWLDAAPKIVNDRTLVPVRAVSESFGAQVSWEEGARLVSVSTGGSNTQQPETPEQPDTPDTPDTPQQPEQGTDVSSFAYRVFTLANAERAAAGLTPLVWSDDLANIALAHSKDMNDRRFMSHTNPDGLSPFDRIRRYGLKYTGAAENIAAGQKSPEEVMQSWMSSEGHRANILNPNLKQLGVGFYEGNGPYRTYWTQVFLTP